MATSNDIAMPTAEHSLPPLPLGVPKPRRKHLARTVGVHFDNRDATEMDIGGPNAHPNYGNGQDAVVD
jgi:hypothetical protein